jgi:succinyl-diaminopimelate desuccinylase
VVIAGHVDTVPLNSNLPSRNDGERLYGLGTCDMKGGVAVALTLAAELREPNRDVTYVFYDHEEVEAARNGLGRVGRNHPEWLRAQFAVLLEPTAGQVEGGCNGTMRVVVTTRGKAAHSARAWMGHNAIHDAATVLGRLTAYEPQEVEVEGLVYRESLNAVLIEGGIAGNVIPDSCRISVNYRFAPSKSIADAEHHLRDLFTGYEVELTDAAGGATPGLDRPAAKAFVAAMGGQALPKYGWTDVARFSELGVPAVNFGPGDALTAHADDEHVSMERIVACERALRAWLSG